MTIESQIPAAIRRTILRRLDEVERANDVRVVYACESGSRAWGFHSTDSDYDVRFIYLHRREWYLSIDRRRDVIELPIEGDLDINGWDLKKALALFRKSNPPLIEWLGSPLVYREVTPVARRLRELLPVCYSPKACLHHYLHMATGNFRSYLRGDRVVRKKYLYVLRPLVAIRWIERGLGVVPTPFETVVDAVIDEPSVRAAIDRLLTDKRAGRELDEGPRIPALADFVEREIERLQSAPVTVPGSPPPWELLNEMFRSSLRTTWGEPADGAGVAIRPAVATDAAALDRIALRSKAHWGYSPAQLTAWRQELATPAESLDRRPTFVAEVDGRPVAFAQIEPSTEPWQLESLWVLPRFMRRGIGRALLARCLAAASSAGRSHLAIDSDPNAEPFYLARGAERVGEVAAPTRDDPDRVRPQLLLATGAEPSDGPQGERDRSGD